jgi:hypothetical protein
VSVVDRTPQSEFQIFQRFRLFQGQKLFDVLFGEEIDVVFPERVGVMKGEDPLVFETDWDDQKSGQDLSAMEIADRFSLG